MFRFEKNSHSCKPGGFTGPIHGNQVVCRVELNWEHRLAVRDPPVFSIENPGRLNVLNQYHELSMRKQTHLKSRDSLAFAAHAAFSLASSAIPLLLLLCTVADK